MKAPSGLLTKKKKKKRVFGVPLDECDTIPPTVLSDCVNYLCNVSGLEVEGLFRKSGNFHTIQLLKKQYDSGKHVDLSGITDPHEVCGLMKQYLRELPEPICSFEYYTMFVAATGIPEENLEARLQQISNVLSLLPQRNQILLKYLIAFLRRVEACKEVNLMTSANLATVFAPNIIRPPEADDVMVMLEYTPVTNCLMQSLITHFDTLLAHFPDPTPPPPTSPMDVSERRRFFFASAGQIRGLLHHQSEEEAEQSTADSSEPISPRDQVFLKGKPSGGSRLGHAHQIEIGSTSVSDLQQQLLAQMETQTVSSAGPASFGRVCIPRIGHAKKKGGGPTFGEQRSSVQYSPAEVEEAILAQAYPIGHEPLLEIEANGILTTEPLGGTGSYGASSAKAERPPMVQSPRRPKMIGKREPPTDRSLLDDDVPEGVALSPVLPVLAPTVSPLQIASTRPIPPTRPPRPPPKEKTQSVSLLQFTSSKPVTSAPINSGTASATTTGSSLHIPSSTPSLSPPCVVFTTGLSHSSPPTSTPSQALKISALINSFEEKKETPFIQRSATSPVTRVNPRKYPEATPSPPAMPVHTYITAPSPTIAALIDRDLPRRSADKVRQGTVMDRILMFEGNPATTGSTNTDSSKNKY